MARKNVVGRRSVIRAVIGVGGIVVPGCAGGDGADSPSPEPSAITDTPTDSQPEPDTPTESPNTDTAVTEHTQDAVEALRTASDRFRREVRKLEASGEDVEFRTSGITAAVAQAQSELDEAATDASNDRRTGIETLARIAEWIRQLATGLGRYDAAMADLRRANTYYLNGRYEDAVDLAGEASEAIEASRSALGRASEVYSNIDVSSVGPVVSADPSEIRSGLDGLRQEGERLNAYVAAMATFSDALTSLSTGRRHYETAKAAGSDGEYGTATEEFATARESFGAALDASRRGEETAPSALLETFIELSCLSEHYREATQHYIEAVTVRQSDGSEATGDSLEQAVAAEKTARGCR